MSPDEKDPPTATTTIHRGDETFVFQPGERIPRGLEREANAALREGRAHVAFGPDAER